MSEIKGYYELSRLQVHLINDFKTLEQDILRAIQTVAETYHPDKRWMAIGKTHIEQGFMAIVKAITQPEKGENGNE